MERRLPGAWMREAGHRKRGGAWSGVCVRGGVAGRNSLCSLEGHEWKEIRGYLRLGHCVVGGLAGTQRQGSSVPPERSGTGLGFGSRWIYFTAIF